MKRMKVSRILALVAISAGIIALARTKKGRQLTKDLADNAGQWKETWTKYAGDKLSHLKDALSKQVDGLSDDARTRINAIIEEGETTGRKAKNKVGNHLG